MTAYKLVWDDFCSWYLESVKPPYGKPIDKTTYETTVGFFEQVLKLLHPFMPFLTEEIWHQLGERAQRDCVIVAEYPQVKRYDNSLLEKAKVAFELISQVRNTRSSKELSPKEKLKLFIKAEDQSTYQHFEPIISKLANLESMEFTSEKVDNAISFLIKSDECFIPMEGTMIKRNSGVGKDGLRSTVQSLRKSLATSVL